ncbi:MAG: DEAD/DEAH box helicase, partial [Gammaproteobacteria bacterium]|nr:DEAD/DEAH box helicase [Gammaproteobacteria bacterium]
MTPPILRIAVPVPIGDSFDYLWNGAGPAPRPGTRISVPFGRSRRIGVVVGVAEASDLPPDKLKPAGEPLDGEPLIGTELLETLRWAADYYHHPIGEVFSQALPGLLRKGRPAEPKREALWTLTPAGAAQDVAAVAVKAARQALALTLLAGGPLAAGELRRAGVAADTLRRLADKGWVQSARGAASPRAGAASAASPPPELTAEQRRALDEIEGHGAGFAAFVLHGATGSGKTEVFLRLIERTLRDRRQALLLVPEIGLTPQLVSRLRDRFGERLSLMHSGLADSVRLDAWHRARTGSAGIVVGTRSAVFAELADPGLVIVDEEHDAAFKQQQGFRYSARDLAVLRARRLDV